MREVTESENLTDWILYMLNAVTATALFTLNKINSISELFTNTLELVKSNKPNIYSYQLVEMLFSQPYCKMAFLVDAGIAARDIASKYYRKVSLCVEYIRFVHTAVITRNI